MGCALGEVRDVKEYITGLEVSPAGRCSLLEGLRINSQFSDHLELASKDLWRASDFWSSFLTIETILCHIDRIICHSCLFINIR